MTEIIVLLKILKKIMQYINIFNVSTKIYNRINQRNSGTRI